MKSTILGMLAETSIHPGSGHDAGFVDLPVAREAATDYPVVVGSSLKGALLDRARMGEIDENKRNSVFGQQDGAGQLLVGDARVLLLPIRSLQGSYKWVTCPNLLERYQRDAARSLGQRADATEMPTVANGQYLGADHQSLFLEERLFERGGDLPDDAVRAVSELLPAMMANHVANRMVILSDDDFAWFARYGLAINARNVLDEVKKTSKNLWYEETIPPDALFYTVLGERSGGALNAVLEMFAERPYLQVGGNETVGQGWFAIKVGRNPEQAGGAV